VAEYLSAALLIGLGADEAMRMEIATVYAICELKNRRERGAEHA
jgi:hypothetical protein